MPLQGVNGSMGCGMDFIMTWKMTTQGVSGSGYIGLVMT